MKSRPRKGLLLACAAMLVAGPARSAGLGEAQVRAFVARQERSWNDGALEAWSAGFRPDATFTDQYRTPAGEIVPYGTSTLSQARTQSRKHRAAAQVSETGRIVRIALGPDGRSAEVVSRVVSRTRTAKGVRIACAERRQDLVLAEGDLRSKGQTDTFSRCPR
ncbi:MAG TPA: hypothetical protein VJS38_08495 [Phenylobacterium sp.]|uniref:hypothetical protein n=1 Tax=Phenylobacterium sp. TaxID=1871053 RepID=UPI002B484934|nr:hypothetical protein [Phenylobacterium sp.]HKR88204.1 hypothetical protein [Phenylobacterium sp.]